MKNISSSQENSHKNHSPLVFFGSSIMSIKCLNALMSQGLKADLIVTTPDKPMGRKLELTPNPTKVWAIDHHVPYFEFDKLNDEAFDALTNLTEKTRAKIFIVASYGKIIPERFLNIPEFGALNIHPSRLPELRGASPLQQTILNDTSNTAVSIIKMDKEMDHGPIFAQKEIDISKIANWPVGYNELELIMANIGAELIAENLDEYLSGSLKLQEQDHADATFTKKITKEDGLINPWLSSHDEQRRTILKIKAFEEWPGTYFFFDKVIKGEHKKLRAIIKDAQWLENKAEGHQLKINKVIPEGGKEMTWESFLQSVGR